MKSRLTLAALSLSLLLPVLPGCVPAAIVAGSAAGVISLQDRRSVGTQTDDETAEWRAMSRIPESYRNTSRISFTSYNRRLLITGEVPDENARAAIEQMARQIEGVRDIYNELGIGPVSPLSSRSNDAFIDSKVKARLVDSRQVSAVHVKVVTERGITYLMGIVNPREAQVATQVARTTAGVRKVVNIMEIVPDAETRRLDAQALGQTSNPAAVELAPVENR